MLSDLTRLLRERKPGSTRSRQNVALLPGLTAEIYPSSILRMEGGFLFLAAQGEEKSLWVWAALPASGVAAALEGKTVPAAGIFLLKKCPLHHVNAVLLREAFAFLRPAAVGPGNSIGLGDRLGLAGPGHLRAVAGSGFMPVLAQQSIRELERTRRRPEEVLDAALWAALEEGYQGGFGADADHLKTEEDIDRMRHAGFLLFTLDPGEQVDQGADRYDAQTLTARFAALPWQELETDPRSALSRFAERSIPLKLDGLLEPSRSEALRAWVKYGAAIARASGLYRHLRGRFGSSPFELEISVDETESATTPFEHYFLASEIRRLGVSFQALAPRFVGGFEKGVDYRGDLEAFRTAYGRHLSVCQTLGGYKLSFHSGSDKFRVYEVVASFPESRIHLKTAGTSYLEALRTLAVCDPALFREILDFSRRGYEEEKRSYHVSADLRRVPRAADLADRELAGLLDQDDARQVLHVCYGRVLTTLDPAGALRFKPRMLACLGRNEETHYGFLEKHIRRHLQSFLRG